MESPQIRGVLIDETGFLWYNTYISYPSFAQAEQPSIRFIESVICIAMRMALFLFPGFRLRTQVEIYIITVAGSSCRKESIMFKVIASEVVVSKGFDNKPAVKFSDKGDTVSVLIGEESGNLVMTVSDTGIGMDSYDLEKIFEPFYQGDNSSLRSGTGIGLPLVRQMCLAMKGKVEAYSIKGEGTSFIVTLPLRQHKSSFEESACHIEKDDSIYDITPDTSCPDKATILIVEDNEDVAEYIGHTLEDRFTLIFAQSGEHGLAKAEEYIPDLIISDVMMPGMDGLSVVRKLRQAQNNTPVLFLSAKGTLQDRVAGLDAGADDYLPKPFAGSELRARVRALLRRRTDYVPDRLVFADLELDAGSCELICKENHVTLSRKAYQVMEAFMRDPHVIISPEQMMERIWGRNSESEIHVVWVNVSFLRKQLKQLGSRTYIRTLRGTGYSLEEQR